MGSPTFEGKENTNIKRKNSNWMAKRRRIRDGSLKEEISLFVNIPVCEKFLMPVSQILPLP
jgi:hypothetical protein